VNYFSFLEKLRSEYIQTGNEDLLFKNKTIVFNKESLKLNVWKDFHGTDSLVVFELKQGSILSTKSYCIGLRLNNHGEIQLLEQEDLWEIWIP